MSKSSFSMHLSRLLVFCCGVSVLGLMAPAAASAQPQDRKTTVTFSGPVEIPSVGAQVLPAGTYVFRLLDSQANRHIVQILDRNESHVFATILAIPNYRLKPTDETVITFFERVAGEPQAIRAWFYPGDSAGHEFAYPRKRAVVLAALTHQPVLYFPDEVAPNTVAPVKTATEPPVIALREAPVKAVAPTGNDIALDTVVLTTPRPTRLPATAGNIPVLALSGLLSLALGLGLSFRRSRRS